MPPGDGYSTRSFDERTGRLSAPVPDYAVVPSAFGAGRLRSEVIFSPTYVPVNLVRVPKPATMAYTARGFKTDGTPEAGGGMIRIYGTGLPEGAHCATLDLGALAATAPLPWRVRSEGPHDRGGPPRACAGPAAGDDHVARARTQGLHRLGSVWARAGTRAVRRPLLLSEDTLSDLDAGAGQDAEQERGEEDLDADDDQRRGEHGEPLLRRARRSRGRPSRRRSPRRRRGPRGRRAAQQQPVLEPEARAHAVEPRVASRP